MSVSVRPANATGCPFREPNHPGLALGHRVEGTDNRKGVEMTRSIFIGIAAMATAIVPLAPATAQPGDIVVSVPAPHRVEKGWNGVHPRMQLAANVLVETRDLDLRTERDRDVLDQRIRYAADVACDRIDQIEPPTGIGAMMNPDTGDCRHLAAKSAELQRYAAIRADYG